MRLDECDKSIQMSILPSLKPYFDLITIENCSHWLMKIRYGHKDIYESFETYELDPFYELDDFYKKKIKLFLDGVALYYIYPDDQIKIVCQIKNDEYYTNR